MSDVKSYEHHTGSSLSAGAILRGRYRIEKILGQGGFGITYAALDGHLHQRVAVKELFPSRYVVRTEDQRTVRAHPGQESAFRHLQESFEKEARTLIDLQNLEGVVRLMHVFSENNTMYYVMELLEGEDLMRRLKREGAMRWEQLVPILKTVMKALEQIHSAGLIHRDISPDNIFLTDHGARLIDFGSVRNFQGEANLTTMVKRNFAPWEQFLSTGHQGPWTDIYALAVTVYYALTGQLPPPATERKAGDKLIPLDALRPELPREICSAIHKGMMVLPENRFQTVRQFKKALNLDDGFPQPNSPRFRLICLRGRLAGKTWFMQPDSVIRVGRNGDCHICYPPDSKGVSRIHCELFLSRDGRFFVRDCGSRYGTRLIAPGKNVVLEPGTWYTADGAHVVFSAQEEFVLMR